MIESQLKEEAIKRIIIHWCKHVKIDHLREGDIPGLARQILREFYQVSLVCGHWVKSVDEGVSLTWQEGNDTITGNYCKECASRMRKEFKIERNNI